MLQWTQVCTCCCEHCVQLFVWTYVFRSLVYIPRRAIAGFYGNSIYNFLRNWQAVFQSGCNILHSHQLFVRVTISPYPRQYSLFSWFLWWQSYWVGITPPYGFNFHFPNEWQTILKIFSPLIVHLYIFFGEISVQIFIQFIVFRDRTF